MMPINVKRETGAFFFANYIINCKWRTSENEWTISVAINLSTLYMVIIQFEPLLILALKCCITKWCMLLWLYIKCIEVKNCAFHLEQWGVAWHSLELKVAKHSVRCKVTILKPRMKAREGSIIKEPFRQGLSADIQHGITWNTEFSPTPGNYRTFLTLG